MYHTINSHLPQATTLFPPLDVPIFGRIPWGYSVSLGLPDAVWLYPFGEIHEPPIDSMVSFFVLLPDSFNVQQEPNLLRIAPNGYTPAAVMEITQLPNITVTDAKHKILADIDTRIYNVSYSGHESFVSITISTRGYEPNRNRYEHGIRVAPKPYRTIHLSCNWHGGVFMRTMHLRLQEDYLEIQHEFWNAINLGNLFPYTLETPHLHPRNDLFIQEMFEPILALMYIPETRIFIELEPFGEISKTEGIASYVFYINTAIRRIEQSTNMLRIDTARQPAFWYPYAEDSPAYMEITQVPNITKEEKIYTILSTTDFLLNEWQQLEELTQLSYFAPHEWNSIATHIFIKDNGLGGVFVITMHYTAEPFCGCPGYASFVHYFNALRTLQIISDNY